MATVLTPKGITYGYTQGDVGWGQAINDDLQRLSAFGISDFAWDPVSSVGLVFAYTEGVIQSGGVFGFIAAGSIALAANSTTYVERTEAGVVSGNTTGFTLSKIPMAVVTTGPSGITTSRDARRVAPIRADGSLALSALSVSGLISGNSISSNSISTPGNADLGSVTVGSVSSSSAGIEVGNSLAAGTTPFVDFHFGVGGSTTPDYNVRLLNGGDGIFSILGIGGSVQLRIGGTIQTNGSISSAGVVSSSLAASGLVLVAQFTNAIAGQTTGLYVRSNMDTNTVGIDASGTAGRILALQTGGTNVLLVNPDQTVTIGSAPAGSEHLRVGGGFRTDGPVFADSLVVFNGTLAAVNTAQGQWALQGQNNTEGLFVGADHLWFSGRVSADSWGVTRGGVLFFAMTSDGSAQVHQDLAVGRNQTINGTLNVASTIYAAGDITAFSDERLKTHVYTITGALGKVLALRGVYYTWRDNPKLGQRMGMIAQEVQKVIPEVVCQADILGGESTLSVAYGNVVALLVEAVRELSARLDVLEAK